MSAAEVIEPLLLAQHQMRSTLSDACTCGHGDLDVLLETGVAIRSHWAHVAKVFQALIAGAWDEGKWACYSAEREGRDGSELINPHRFGDA